MKSKLHEKLSTEELLMEIIFSSTINNNRFPNSKREEWVNIFPSFTTREEIGLVDGLVKYNPKKRLTAAEVSL